MVTNYYNASNNFSAPIRREPKPFRPQYPERQQDWERERVKGRENDVKPVPAKKGFLEELDQDTILIIGLVILLLLSGCEDKLLLIALGYLVLF